jgi:hypothetical protein
MKTKTIFTIVGIVAAIGILTAASANIAQAFGSCPGKQVRTHDSDFSPNDSIDCRNHGGNTDEADQPNHSGNQLRVKS